MTEANRETYVRQLTSRMVAYWSEEHSLTALLGSLVLYHLLNPLFVDLQAGRLLTAAYLTVFSVSGMLAVAKRRNLSIAVRIIASAVLVAAWSEVVYPGRVTMALSGVLDVALLSLVLVAVGLQVFQSGPVTAHRIRGAIVIYLLIGAVFGVLYVLIVMVEPGAIKLSSDLDTGNAQAIRSELSYFSLVTLASLGYGDVLPVSPFARALATLEALSGQLFVAITLARLVSGQVSASDDTHV